MNSHLACLRRNPVPVLHKFDSEIYCHNSRFAVDQIVILGWHHTRIAVYLACLPTTTIAIQVEGCLKVKDRQVEGLLDVYRT